MSIINKKIVLIIIFTILSILTITSIGLAYYFYFTKESCQEIVPLEVDKEEIIDNTNVEKTNMIYVEVKGAVKNPGVYEVFDNTIINDVISKAGGFTSSAYTNNINLSKKVSDELVIYVFTKTEYKKNSTQTSVQANNTCSSNDYLIDNCTSTFSSVIISDSTNSLNANDETVESNLVNINTASKETLMTLPGIGESKAQLIIDYRTNTGLFNTIEEIKNVSGIGDSTYEKLKDYIMV